MVTNAELLKNLKLVPRARFYLCDLHVHSPASSDVRCGERFDLLPPEHLPISLGWSDCTGHVKRHGLAEMCFAN